MRPDIRKPPPELEEEERDQFEGCGPTIAFLGLAALVFWAGVYYLLV